MRGVRDDAAGRGLRRTLRTDFIGSYGSGPSFREAVADINAKVVRYASFPTPVAAADALTSGAADLLAAFSTHHDMSARRPAPWYGSDIALPVNNLLSLAVSEFLVHGYDLVRTVGATAPLRRHRCFSDRGGRRRDERDAPYHALLMGYNRVPAWRVIASGKAWAYGRRPWLGLRFDHLFLKV